MTDSRTAQAPRRRDLHDGWTLSITDGPAPFAAVDVPAEVPGTLITDLLAAGLIEDPYRDRNELDLAWTGECDVLYRTRFTAAAPAGERVDLVAASLDTAATVVLNGQHVATVQNQHRSWRFDVTDALREGDNELEIRFASPLRTARENQAVLGELPVVGNQLPYNAIRKMACNFGWDWGPVLVTSGIAGPIGLEQWSVGRIAELRPQVTVGGDDGDVGSVALHAELERSRTGSDAPLELSARVLDPAGAEVAAARTGGTGAALDLALEVADPQRWWPRGYGDQPLYTVEVTLAETDGTVRDRREHRIAFRTAGVVEEPDEIGTSFTVVVNDRPVLAMGANWIPDDCFPTRLRAEDYAASVADAVDAGMNMLRIWGGGLYESEHLYDLCDELGLLVWQDFTTACAAYSELEPLRSEFEAEARQNIVRLAWHPSLIHWNGSNENVEGYYHWGWKETIPEGVAWGLGYYTELFPSLLAELDPTRSYTPTSPYSRPLPEDPRNPDHGTVHNWVAWASEEDNDYERYRDTVPRFSAEFGYQGPANHATLARAITERPLDQDSPTMLSHQKAIGGQDKLRRGLHPHLPVPEGFDDFHAATQLNQARALICGIGHYRSHWPVCGGTIVWQLNDCWPVISWAAVDGDGRRKPLWYALRDLYAPVLLTVQPREAGPAISLGNDTDEEIATRVLLRRQDHDGAVLAEAEIAVQVDPRSSATLPVPAALAAPDDAACEVLLVELAGRPERTVHFFAEDVDSRLPDGALSATAEATPEGALLTLTASATVRDVCVHADRVAPDAVADRQLLTLLPGETATVRVRTSAEVDPRAFLAPSVLVSANDLVTRARVPAV